MFLTKFYVFVLLLLLDHIALTESVETSEKNQTSYNYRIKKGQRLNKDVLAKCIVSLERADTKFGHFCAGCIYNESEIITAAHCLVYKRNIVKDPKNIRVVAGVDNRFIHTSKTQIRRGKEIFLHPRYSRLRSHEADLAILTLDKDLQFDGETVEPAELVNERLPIKTNCTVFGWGCMHKYGPASDELRFINKELQANCICARKWQNNFRAGMICAQNCDDPESGTCKGDSGGPMICRDKLAGIVSFGNMRGGYPDVYTDIYYYNDWLLLRAAAYRIEQIFNLIVASLGFIIILV